MNTLSIIYHQLIYWLWYQNGVSNVIIPCILSNKNICRLLQIHELGNPKAKKADDVPEFYEVCLASLQWVHPWNVFVCQCLFIVICALLSVYACVCPVQVTEPAKALLDAGEEIPCDLMANILKFQLLQIKADDQQRREAEQVSVFLHICESIMSIMYSLIQFILNSPKLNWTFAEVLVAVLLQSQQFSDWGNLWPKTFWVFVCSILCLFCPHLFQREEAKAKAGPTSASKGGAKVPNKNGKNSSSPAGLSKEKKTKLKRRDDVEPPKFIGKNSNLSHSCLGGSLIA